MNAPAPRMFLGAVTSMPGFWLSLLAWLGWLPDPEPSPAGPVVTQITGAVSADAPPWAPPQPAPTPVATGRCAVGWSPVERIVPSFEEGTARGFKIFGIRPGSLLATSGLHNGDIVRTINRLDLMAPEKSLHLYASLKGRTLLRLDILRKGQPWVVHYRSPEPLFSDAWYQQVCGGGSAELTTFGHP